MQELEEQEKRCHSDKMEMGRMMKELQARAEEMFREQVGHGSRWSVADG